MAQIKKTSSLFMILLVMLIPICVSDAYAATVEIRQISGADGVDRYMRGDDQITINAFADLGASEDVTDEKLRVYVDSLQAYATFNVGGCQRVAEGSSEFNCTYTSNVFGVTGSHQYTVKLFKDSTKNIPGASAEAFDSATVTVDRIGAKVTSIEVVPNRTRGGNIQINYESEDYAEIEGDTTKCSGVENVEFYLGDFTGSLIKVEETYNICDPSGSFTYDAGVAEGDYTICAKAYDRLGQGIITAACAGYSVDRTAPEADIASLVLVDSSTGNLVEYVGGNTGATADISIIIDAVDLEPGTVKADFSNLGGGSDVPPSGSPAFDGASIYIFTWANVQISPSLTACAFEVYAEDEIGNFVTTTVPCGISIDNQGPQIQQIMTPYLNPDDGLYYLGNKTNITAVVSEPGIGVNKTDSSGKHSIYMHLDPVGDSRGRRAPADDCIFYSGDTWYCIWEDVEPSDPQFPDGTYLFQISGESKDDLGNIMGAVYEQDLGLDRTSPSLDPNVNMTLTPGVNYDPAAPGVILTGDRLEFEVCTTDVYSARADFLAIGGGDDVLPASCDTSTAPPCCTFEVDVSDSGPYDADISFTFMDSTGNMATISKSITVSGFYDEPEPDFWDITSLVCSPDYIDREIASLYPYPMYCYIKLEESPMHPLAETLAFSMEDFPVDCTASNSDLAIQDYIEDIQVMNNIPGSKSPFLFITLRQTEFLLDSFEFTCEFEMYTKETKPDGDHYTLNPEPENVTVNIRFYDLPVGTLGNNYDNALTEVADELEWMEGWFDELYAVMEALKGTCNTYVAISTVLTGITALGAVFGIFAGATTGTPYWSGLDNVWQSTCKGTDSSQDGVMDIKADWLDDICAWVNCEYTTEGEMTWYGVQDTDWWTDNMQGGGFVGGGSPADDDVFSLGTAPSGYEQEFDVKDSIIWSIATLCVPGILYNINKLREIDCQYGVCLLAAVPQGLPQDACDSIYDYMTCKFWWGELFNALPWTNAWSNLMQDYQALVSDPATALGSLLMARCENACTSTADITLSNKDKACMILHTIKMIDDAWSEVEKIADNAYFETGTVYCDEYYALLV